MLSPCRPSARHLHMFSHPNFSKPVLLGFHEGFTMMRIDKHLWSSFGHLWSSTMFDKHLLINLTSSPSSHPCCKWRGAERSNPLVIGWLLWQAPLLRLSGVHHESPHQDSFSVTQEISKDLLALFQKFLAVRK
jgi:hypothetical protein